MNPWFIFSTGQTFRVIFLRSISNSNNNPILLTTCHWHGIKYSSFMNIFKNSFIFRLLLLWKPDQLLPHFFFCGEKWAWSQSGSSIVICQSPDGCEVESNNQMALIGWPKVKVLAETRPIMVSQWPAATKLSEQTISSSPQSVCLSDPIPTTQFKDALLLIYPEIWASVFISRLQRDITAKQKKCEDYSATVAVSNRAK